MGLYCSLQNSESAFSPEKVGAREGILDGDEDKEWVYEYFKGEQGFERLHYSELVWLKQKLVNLP